MHVNAVIGAIFHTEVKATRPGQIDTYKLDQDNKVKWPLSWQFYRSAEDIFAEALTSTITWMVREIWRLNTRYNRSRVVIWRDRRTLRLYHILYLLFCTPVANCRICTLVINLLEKGHLPLPIKVISKHWKRSTCSTSRSHFKMINA